MGRTGTEASARGRRWHRRERGSGSNLPGRTPGVRGRKPSPKIEFSGFPVFRFSGFPVFRFSGFPVFRFSGFPEKTGSGSTGCQ
jgi:hypothetical protein